MAELIVLVGGGIAAPMKEIVPRFEAKTGHKLAMKLGATPDLIKIATGSPFDAVVAPGDVYKNDGVRAKLGAAQPVTIAHVGFGVAVKTGAAKPDVSTPDKFKATLLNAQAISTLVESAAGSYVMKVFDKLGIANQVRPKIKAQKTPSDIPAAVAKGEAELAIFLANIVTAPGVDFVGPFPGDLQQHLQYGGAVAADSKNAAAAKAFIDYLKSPEAAAVFKAKDVTPG
jgi:molybdate transport system substrate-binding protein